MVGGGITGGGVAGLESRVFGFVREPVCWAHVLGFEPLRPRDPLLRQEGVRAGQEGTFADGGRARARDAGNRDGPVPAVIPGVRAREGVGAEASVLEDEAQVLGYDVRAFFAGGRAGRRHGASN